MKPITLYTANCRENQYNTRYPVRREIATLDDLKAAVEYDQVFAEYLGNHRSITDFIRSDCLPFDCDNDHSDIKRRDIHGNDGTGQTDYAAFQTQGARNKTVLRVDTR